MERKFNNHIEKFISDFKKGHDKKALEETFLNGNCYHFASILDNLFYGDIMYSQKYGHFTFRIFDYKLFDITGMIECDESYVTLLSISKTDDTFYQRLLNECVYKGNEGI